MSTAPDTISDLELDALESQIPNQALMAARLAHHRALVANPQGILNIDDGNVVRVSLDGKKTIVAKAQPRRKVKVGEVIRVRCVEGTNSGA